jgi:hypothetical protein
MTCACKSIVHCPYLSRQIALRTNRWRNEEIHLQICNRSPHTHWSCLKKQFPDDRIIDALVQVTAVYGCILIALRHCCRHDSNTGLAGGRKITDPLPISYCKLFFIFKWIISICMRNLNATWF